MAVELTSNKRKKIEGKYKGKRKLATKRLADVTAEELEAWEKRTGKWAGLEPPKKKGLTAYLNAQRTIKSKGDRLQPGDHWRQVQKAASRTVEPKKRKTREQYAAASKKAGTSAAGMKPKRTVKKVSGGGSDKLMEKKRSLVNRLRDKLAGSKMFRDLAGEKTAKDRSLKARSGPPLRGGGMVKKYNGGGSIQARGAGGLVQRGVRPTKMR